MVSFGLVELCLLLVSYSLEMIIMQGCFKDQLSQYLLLLWAVEHVLNRQHGHDGQDLVTAV